MNLRPVFASALLGLVTALSSNALYADDIDIYVNPSANPLQPPMTILTLDLNVLGICNSLVTQSVNPSNPTAPQVCLNVGNTLVLRDVLAGINDNPLAFLSQLLLGSGSDGGQRAQALCNLYGILGINSPLVNLPAVGFLLAPLLGGVSALTCGTLNFLLGIPLLGAIVNPLLGGFVGQLVAGLLDPLLGTVVAELPGAVVNLLNPTITGVLNLGQIGLISLLETILNQLINSRVAIVVSHADRASLAGAPASACAFGEQAAIPLTRRETPNCSNGAYFLTGFTPLVDQGAINGLLGTVTSLLTNSLTPTNVVNSVTGLAGTLLTTPLQILPPFQGKEIYAEIVHYLAGDEVYNAPLKQFDGLTSLLSRDTSIEVGGRYLRPPTECRSVNVLNVQLTNAIRDGESDATLASYFPGAVSGGSISFPSVVREAADPGFTDPDGGQIKLRSFFLVQDNLSDLTALTMVGANVVSYIDNLGLLNRGQSVAQLLKPSLSVDASLLTPSLTQDLSAPNRILPPAFFGLFRPSANQSPRWNGNLKRFNFVDGVYRDVNGADAIAADGRIATSALSEWTAPATIAPALSDGRDVTKGGAGSRIPASGRSNTDTAARQILFERSVNGALTLANLNAEDPVLQTLLQPIFGALSPAETRALMLYARGWEVGTSAAPAPDLAAVAPRPWRHGAVLHSQPVAINYGARPGFTAANPDVRILYGANDGFLRMVRNDTGIESWAFLPQAVMSQQKVLRDNAPGSRFPYGVDGSPTLIIQDRSAGGGPGDGVINSADDKVWAYVGLRRSGKSLYGLNLSNPDAPSLLWRIDENGLTSNSAVAGNPANAFNELALGFSQPQAARLRIDGQPRIVLIFGGGYNGGRNPANQPLEKDAESASSNTLGTNDAIGNAVFMVDAETGELLWKAAQGAFNAEAPYNAAARRFNHPLLNDGIAADINALDMTGDGLTDRVYVVDTGGRLWRGDFPGDDRSDWTFGPIASVGRHDNPTVPTDRRFFHAVDVVPVRGAQDSHDAVIFASGNRADPRERVQDNALYVMRDRHIGVGVDPADLITAENQLPGHLDFADLTTVCALSDAVDCAANADLDTGWRIQLTGAGEKALSQPLTLGNTIFLSTFIPEAPTAVVCEPSEGGGRLYAVSLQDSRPSLAGVFEAGTGGSAGGRAREVRAPGLVGDLSMADIGTARTGTEVVDIAVPRFVPIYWRERRGEDDTLIPQGTP